jgi:hypothetical protein
LDAGHRDSLADRLDVVACAFTSDPDGPPGTARILKLERPVTFSGNPWASLA